jgi:hypothetical protein
LMDSIRRLAAGQPRYASPRVEEKLVSAFRAQQPRKVTRWLYAAAACVVLAIGTRFMHRHRAPAVYVYDAPGFVALPYAQSGVPLESVVVIRVEMRPSELSSMGVAVPAAASTAKLTADFLVGQDGVARAVRLVE